MDTGKLADRRFTRREGVKLSRIMKSNIMTIEEMKKRKRELKYSYLKLSELSGVPYSTVQKVLGGVTKSPGYRTICALTEVLSQEEGISAATVGKKTACVQEPGSGYGCGCQMEQGCMTGVTDRYGSEEWAERLVSRHSAAAAESSNMTARLCSEIGSQLREKKIPAEIFLFPVPVFPDGSSRTVFYPDLCIVTKDRKVQKARILGAPDIVIDIFPSPSGREAVFAKLDKYQENHLKEYWAVSGKEKRVTVFRMDGEPMAQSYSFRDVIPMYLNGNELLIDFTHIAVL